MDLYCHELINKFHIVMTFAVEKVILQNAKIRIFLPKSLYAVKRGDRNCIVHAFISSKLDNLNALLCGLPDNSLQRLQMIQNTAARIVCRMSKYDHISPLLYQLHWLSVKYQIQYKILLLVYKCLNNLAPGYLSSLLTRYQPERSLRSSSLNLLKQPPSRLKSYGDRAFSVCGPRLWNSLPSDVRSCTTLDHFKTSLKTYLFKQAYCDNE